MLSAKWRPFCPEGDELRVKAHVLLPEALCMNSDNGQDVEAKSGSYCMQNQQVAGLHGTPVVINCQTRLHHKGSFSVCG